MVTADDVKKWWICCYWSSLLMYAQNAILANEFSGHSWSKLVNGNRLGESVMLNLGFYPQSYWYWIGVAACTGFVFIYNICYLYSLTFLNRDPYVQVLLTLLWQGIQLVAILHSRIIHLLVYKKALTMKLMM
ncbi:hypothetical protein ACS0TY_030167 [Phlomoides rotata]